MNSEKILKTILRINFTIKSNFLKKTEFEDEFLEAKFQEKLYITEVENNLASNLVVFLGYLATFIYIFFAFYRVIYIINCTLFFFLALVSLTISSIYKTRKILLINNHIQIFLSSINLAAKGFFVCLNYNLPENDKVEELLRIIIYNFVSTNIYLITRLEANIFVSIFYFLLNLAIIILGYLYSKTNTHYFLESFVSFFLYVICYALCKEWDYHI